jgi:hypothetical protein
MAGSDSAMPPAAILGIGAVTPLGRDLDGIAKKLCQPADTSSAVRRVSDEHLADTSLSRNLRRADRFTRMAVMAAVDAWNMAKAACTGVPLERVGKILSSGFGPHCRGFKFLDGLIDAGDGATSPTDFSHSVHGAACAYISGLLDIRGPSLTVTDFEIGFEQSVQLAQCWLAEGACDRVLIGAVDEVGDVLLHCASRMLCGAAHIQPGEGALFMVLGPGDSRGAFAHLDATTMPKNVDLLISEQPIVDGSSKGAPTIDAKQHVTFTSHFGYSASTAAFQLLGGFLRLRRQADNDSIDNAATLRTSSDARAAAMLLERISA